MKESKMAAYFGNALDCYGASAIFCEEILAIKMRIKAKK